MSRPAENPAGEELSTDEIKHGVLDEIKKFRTRAVVAFSGGEHLLRDDALEVIEYNASLGLWSFLNTNGLLLDEKKLDELRTAARERLVIVLPFNSINGAVQEKTRNDSLRTVLEASDRCEKLGIHYFYLVTVSRENIETLAGTMEYLRRRQVPVLRDPFVTRGAGASCRELLFTRADMESAIHPALTSNPLSYVSFTPFFASPELWKEADTNGRLLNLGCQAARSFAAINAEGDVSPCVQLLDSDVVCGNVRQRPLSDILENHPTFNALRTRQDYKGKCGRCRYKMTCGGCRALAFYHSGDVLAEDPTCFFEPENETTVSALEEKQSLQLATFIDYIKYNEPWNVIF
jgi:radical SAM protein with 4Fe4S-binding SPASM domain